MGWVEYFSHFLDHVAGPETSLMSLKIFDNRSKFVRLSK